MRITLTIVNVDVGSLDRGDEEGEPLEVVGGISTRSVVES